MWKFALPLVAAVGLIGLFYLGLQNDPTELPSPLIERQAPAFDLADIYGSDERVTSELLNDQVVLVNIWATWCPPCRDEHPFLVELAQQHGVKIIGINWQDDRAAALEWLRVLGDPYVAVGFDPEGRAGIDWGVYGAPETFLVDANGVVRYKHIAQLTPAVWESEFVPRIQALSGEDAP